MSRRARLKAWFHRVGSRNGPKASSKTTVKSVNPSSASPVALESAPTKETASISRIDQDLCRLLQGRGYEWRSLRGTDLNWTQGRACYLGHADVVSALLARGVSPSEPSKFTKAPLRGGFKPLHIAVCSRRPNTIKLLAAKGADLNTRDEVGRAPLHYADREDIVEVLLECGADINARDDLGDTPLHAAARDGRGAALEALLANGADLNDSNVSGLTAMWLIPLSNPEILDHLMRVGADILSTRDSEGRTLLHLAARKGTSRFVRGLLDRDADIEALDTEGRTPLFHAILGARHANIKALLERGASLDVRDTHGSTPIQLAEARRMAYTVGMLRQHQVARGASARPQALDPTFTTRRGSQIAELNSPPRGSTRWLVGPGRAQTSPQLSRKRVASGSSVQPPAQPTGNSLHYQPWDHRSKYERDTGLTDPMILRWD